MQYYFRLKGNLENEYQQIKVENARLKQMIQEISNRGGGEVEQWRKLVDQEKHRADKAESEIKSCQQQLQVRIGFEPNSTNLVKIVIATRIGMTEF